MRPQANTVTDTLSWVAVVALIMMLTMSGNGAQLVKGFSGAFEGAAANAIYGPNTPYLSSTAMHANQKTASGAPPSIINQAPAAQSQNALKKIWPGCPSWLCGK